MSEKISLLCRGEKKDPTEMLSKSFNVNQSVGAVARWEAKAGTHFCSKHKLNLTVHLDTPIQRKSTLNLNMNMKIEDVHLFP